MAKTSLTTAEGKTACNIDGFYPFDFSNVTELNFFTAATWYGNYTTVGLLTGLNSTILD